MQLEPVVSRPSATVARGDADDHAVEPTAPDARRDAAHRAPPHGGFRPGHLRERVGDAIGRLWAPAVAAISRFRHARMFHPDGLMFAGRVVPAPEVPAALATLAARFDGRALVRCSAALWKTGREHLDGHGAGWRGSFDVLGFALRVRPGDGLALDETALDGDQDLLFATIRSPLTMLASPLFTDATDFVHNRYWAVSPFAAAGSRYELRLSPVDPPARGTLPEPRAARLLTAVHAHSAAWDLEVRETWTLRWRPIARIVLERPVTLDQSAIAFDPFRAGLGVVPVGVIHAIRRAAYAASRAGRAR